MFQVHLLAYPWDVLDEGSSERLARLHGELGVDGLALWMATPPVSELRPREVRPRTFVSRGGFLFQPSDRHFHGLRCPPIVSSWLRTGNPVAEMSRRCREHGLQWRAVVSAALVGPMAERYPELSSRNAFGDESRLSICPSNPEVQAILRATVAQLSATDPLASLVLTDIDIAWHEAWSTDLRLSADLGSAERSLLAVCFCDSCVRIANSRGLDVVAARAVVVRALEDAFSHGPGRSESFADAPSLQAYVRRSRESLDAFLRGLKQVARCPLILDLGGCGSSGVSLEFADGIIRKMGDLDVQPTQPSADVPRGEIRVAAHELIGERGARLVGGLGELAQRGVTGLTIDHLGLLTDEHLTVIRQATRFARRTVDL